MAGNLRVKVWVPPQADGVSAERFVVCHNPEQAWRDQLVRHRLVAHLEGLIDGSDAWPQRKRDELAGSLRDKQQRNSGQPPLASRSVTVAEK